MSTNAPATTENRDPWDDEPFKLSPERATDAGYRDPEQERINQILATGGTLSYDELFPDQDDETPWLQADMKHGLAESGEPLIIAQVTYDTRGKFGAKWNVKLDVGGTMFRLSLPSSEARDEDMRLMSLVTAAGRPIGPVKLEEIDTGKGNPFYRFRAIKLTAPTASAVQEKAKKSALTDMGGKTGG